VPAREEAAFRSQHASCTIAALTLCSLALFAACGGAEGVQGRPTQTGAVAPSRAPASGGPLGDPVALWPDIYSVLAENEYVRLMEIRLKPGARDDWHGHPASAGYVLSEGSVRTEAADGTTKDVVARRGMAAAHPPIGQHRMENVGTTDVHILFAERKGDPPRLAQAYIDAPSAEPNVYRVVAESDWFRVIEIEGPPGVEGPVHSHQASVVYAIEAAHVAHTIPGEAPVEQTLPGGKAVYVPAVDKHTMRNLGPTPTRIVMFELR
jgi:quercetin dioxygenase-like cupin family protein